MTFVERATVNKNNAPSASKKGLVTYPARVKPKSPKITVGSEMILLVKNRKLVTSHLFSPYSTR
jgi:hypothetical protein